jgi:hypothetical protein
MAGGPFVSAESSPQQHVADRAICHQPRKFPESVFLIVDLPHERLPGSRLKIVHRMYEKDVRLLPDILVCTEFRTAAAAANATAYSSLR